MIKRLICPRLACRCHSGSGHLVKHSAIHLLLKDIGGISIPCELKGTWQLAVSCLIATHALSPMGGLHGTWEENKTQYSSSLGASGDFDTKGHQTDLEQ